MAGFYLSGLNERAATNRFGVLHREETNREKIFATLIVAIESKRRATEPSYRRLSIRPFERGTPTAIFG
jgi:hypothetical protein